MPKHVLVVDDEEDFLHSIVRRIELRGIEVDGVTGGAAAIEYLSANPETVQVVLLDIKMPGMDGIETLRRIKDCCPGIEVIVVTGHASQEFSRLGRELGAFDYLIKPVRLDTILERIKAAMRGREGSNDE
ncbi:MAG: response regulator [Candidatus Sulfomarinibacteraceae bacterium]|jgi:DNA-binding response OmpR family regulator